MVFAGEESSMQKLMEAGIRTPCIEEESKSKLKAEEEEVYRQLWLTCAGPLIQVPRVGDKVFYFPQGHIEQVQACTSKDNDVPMPIYNVPYKILCLVVSVQLEADPTTDEVIAQITLLPQRDGQTLELKFASPVALEGCIRSFNKKLTPSDTSTNGGLTVPRKAASECFPPLDMFQHLPSQELVAKDLHGIEWPFRHIYRGQPKRHLLGSGWSSFVNSKKLVAGDTCIFYRGKTSKLLIGIRRATKPKKSSSAALLSSQSLEHGVLSGAFHAISTGSMFNVYYDPWKCSAEFLIPYNQYMKASEIEYSFGMRFKMQYEPVHGGFQVGRTPTFGGTIIGVKDIDNNRWPGSEWRCAQVKWDSKEEATLCPERVSPWCIDVVELSKRKRKSMPPEANKPHYFNPLFPFSVKEGVLQGQEFGIVAVYRQQTSAPPPVAHLCPKFYGWGDKHIALDNQHFLQFCDHQANTTAITSGVSTNLEIGIFSFPTSTSRATKHKNGGNKSLSLNIDSFISVSQKKCVSEITQVAQHGAGGSGKCMLFGVNINLLKVPSPHFVLGNEIGNLDVIPPPSLSLAEISKTIHDQDQFGGSLKQQLSSRTQNRSCTKVMKYGAALGRSIDLSRFNGYEELVAELDKTFEFSGTLVDESSNWHISYADGEGYKIKFGDCPWMEFRATVRKMFICPQDIDEPAHRGFTTRVPSAADI